MMKSMKRMIAFVMAMVLLGTTVPALAAMDANTSGKVIDGWNYTSHFSDSEV